MRHGALILAGWMLLLAAPAQADEMAVGELEGRHGAALRNAIVRALEDAGVTVVTGRSVPRVEGSVQGARRGWRAELRVEDADGRELAREVLRARRPRALSRQARRWIEAEVAPLAVSPTVPEPSPPPEQQPVLPPAPDDAPAEVREPETAAAPQRLPLPLVFRVGVAVTNRSFAYNDDVFGTLQPYELAAAPVLALGVEWFPGGHVDLGVLSGLSVRAEGEVVLGVETVGSNGSVHPTEMWALGGGLRYALSIDDVQLFVDGGYRAFVFSIHDASELEPRPAVPNVELHAIRAGGGFRWDIGSGLFFTGQAAYLAPLAVGEVTSAEWFPRATVGGFEADIGLGVRVDEIELRAFFAMRRFFYAMNPEPGDARVAGGAIDQSLSGVLELVWRPSSLAQ